MRVAVTQPYLFPYLGYFALLNRVDVCVLMDETQYIRRGWIHRNQIPLISGEPLRFGVPVQKSPRSTKIRDILLSPTLWRKPLRRTFEVHYAKAPFQDVGLTRLGPLWAPETHLFPLVKQTLEQTATYLGLKTQFRLESELNCYELGAAPRMVALAKAVGGTELHNLPGGRALYDEAWFAAQGMPLHFVESGASWSVLHYLMTEPKAVILESIRGWGRESHKPCTPAIRNPSERQNAAPAPLE